MCFMVAFSDEIQPFILGWVSSSVQLKITKTENEFSDECKLHKYCIFACNFGSMKAKPRYL